MANAGKQNREVGVFRKIQVSAGIDVYFTQEKSQSVRIETENVEVDEIVTEVKNEALVIKMKDRNNRGTTMQKQSIKVYVSAPVLEGLSTSGGSDFYANNLKSSDFGIAASGGSDIHIGNLAVSGKTDIATSGGSDCDIKNLKTGVCRIATSGGSDTKIGIEVSGELTVATSGASDVKLSGTANTVSILASGSSDVDVRNLKYEKIDSKTSGGADVHK
ncbi:hypothetical protein AGMMS50239_22320 [Bacteroidia bacterium]|nr:hypothetical protein AGMMS50239_22320 [Bacteroidia bacterium]